MRFGDWEHEQAVRQLRQDVQSGQLAHAYLLAGPATRCKQETVDAFSQALLCLGTEAGEPCNSCDSCNAWGHQAHPDYHSLAPEGSSLKIEQIRQWQPFFSYRPQLGRHQVFLLSAPELLTDPAANSLLKILEEPLPQTVFLLTTEDERALLPTLVSRCRVVLFRPGRRESSAVSGLRPARTENGEHAVSGLRPARTENGEHAVSGLRPARTENGEHGHGRPDMDRAPGNEELPESEDSAADGLRCLLWSSSEAELMRQVRLVKLDRPAAGRLLRSLLSDLEQLYRKARHQVMTGQGNARISKELLECLDITLTGLQLLNENVSVPLLLSLTLRALQKRLRKMPPEIREVGGGNDTI
jgi:DNA polymerase III delta' subunit